MRRLKLCPLKILFGCALSLVFSVFGLLFAFSSDASALTLTLDAVPTGVQHYISKFDCMYSRGTYTLSQDICALTHTDSSDHRTIYAIRSSESFQFYEGYYYEFIIGIQSPNLSRAKGLNWFPSVLDADWVLTDFEEIQATDSFEYFQGGIQGSGNSSSLSPVSSYSNLYRVVLYSKTTSVRPFIFGNEYNTLLLLSLGYSQYSGTSSANIAFGQIREYNPSDIAEHVDNPQWVQDQRQEVQDETSRVQTDVEDNQDIKDIQNQTTNLISILTQFVDAVAFPIQSTCILPIDLTGYKGFQFYEVDLCHLSPPSGITAVLNVVFVFVVLGLVVSGVRLIVSLFKEITSF